MLLEMGAAPGTQLEEHGLEFTPHCHRQAARQQSTASTAVHGSRAGGSGRHTDQGQLLCEYESGVGAGGILERPREARGGSLRWLHVSDDTQIRTAAWEVKSTHIPMRLPQLWHPRSTAELDWTPQRRWTKDTRALTSI